MTKLRLVGGGRVAILGWADDHCEIINDEEYEGSRSFSFVLLRDLRGWLLFLTEEFKQLASGKSHEIIEAGGIKI